MTVADFWYQKFKELEKENDRLRRFLFAAWLCFTLYLVYSAWRAYFV